MNAYNFSAAMTVLNTEGIDIHANFHTLSSAQVCALVDLAKAHKYRKPKNANGSTARYYFAALGREHRRERQ